MKIEKFGKSSEGLLSIKKSFFSDNAFHLNEQERINKIFLTQPTRTNCKNCAASIAGSDFKSHDVEYKICAQCGHLNGMHQETESFFHKVYHDDAGSTYGANYQETTKEAFDFRVRKIYTPKVDFLLEVLTTDNQETQSLSYADFGAGSGYLVAALAEKNLKAQGLEVSSAQVNLGNKLLGQNLLSTFDPKLTTSLLTELKCDVLSLIGVLEHVPDPREALQAIKRNKHIKYLYLSLPLFSTSVFFELLFPQSYNRQLGGGHTHLYTPQSIDYFAKEFGYTKLGQWYFGTDFMDLYRHTMLNISGSVSETALSFFNNTFGKQMDEIQLALDKARLSSETHVVLKL